MASMPGTRTPARCFVHIASSLAYLSIAGNKPPGKPPTAETYTRAALPWFEYYAMDRKALKGAVKLIGLDSVAAMKIKKGEGPLASNDPVSPEHVVPLGDGQVVREGDF